MAAISLAQRVAQEMRRPQLGDYVGYSIRFDDKTSKNTKIKFLTDGMLLREAIVDHTLASYKVIVLDEIHERTVNTDVLLALLKELLA